jgi:hypothetical protein
LESRFVAARNTIYNGRITVHLLAHNWHVLILELPLAFFDPENNTGVKDLGSSNQRLNDLHLC